MTKPIRPRFLPLATLKMVIFDEIIVLLGFFLAFFFVLLGIIVLLGVRFILVYFWGCFLLCVLLGVPPLNC